MWTTPISHKDLSLPLTWVLVHSTTVAIFLHIYNILLHRNYKCVGLWGIRKFHGSTIRPDSTWTLVLLRLSLQHRTLTYRTNKKHIEENTYHCPTATCSTIIDHVNLWNPLGLSSQASLPLILSTGTEIFLRMHQLQHERYPRPDTDYFVSEIFSTRTGH